MTITSAYFLQFCFGISIQLQRVNLTLSCQKIKYGAIQTKMWPCQVKMTIQCTIQSSIGLHLLCRLLRMDQSQTFKYFTVRGSNKWSYWINRRVSVMEAHSCSIEQNILMCQCPFLYNTPALCSPIWQESPKTAKYESGQIILQWGEETTNFPIVSCRIAIITGKGCIWLYDYMLCRASPLIFSWTYQ